MKRVYVYNFIPLNEVRIHTATTQEELENIKELVNKQPNTYKIIYEMDAEVGWTKFRTRVVDALNHIFKECESNIRFEPIEEHLGEGYPAYSIQPTIPNNDPFVYNIKVEFTNYFYTQVRSIISELGAEVVKTKICDDDEETTLVFRRKEDVKGRYNVI